MTLSSERDIYKYYNRLVDKTKNYLEKNEFNYKSIINNDYDLINTFLISKLLFEEQDYSLFIKILEKDVRDEYIIPVLFSISSILFFKNYIDDITEYNIGDVIQSGRDTYLIQKIENKRYCLINSRMKRNVNDFKKEEKDYIIIKKELSERRQRDYFEEYRKYYKLLFNTDYVPSFFKHKAVIFLEHNHFNNVLGNIQNNTVDLRKAIPYKWINRNGENNEISDNLPIEPMIYIMHDYDTFREGVAKTIANLDCVIFIGSNLYSEYLNSINFDLQRRVIKKCILVGCQDVKNLYKLKRWEWTVPERFYSKGQELGKIDIITIKDSILEQEISKLKNYFIELSNLLTLTLNDLMRYITKYNSIYSYINKYSEIENEKELLYLKSLCIKNISEEFKERLLSINIEYDEYLSNIIEKIHNIFNAIAPIKLFKLEGIENKYILITERDNIYDIIKHLDISLIDNKNKVYDLEEFEKIQEGYTNRKDVYFLSVFSNDFKYNEIVDKVKKYPHNFHFILYHEEVKILNYYINRYNRNIIEEIKSEDRRTICEIQTNFKMRETIQETIDKFFKEADIKSKGREYNYETIYYKMQFDDNSEIVLDGNSTIIIENTRPRKTKVYKLSIGDIIRIYENTRRKELLDIVLSFNDKVKEILYVSDKWKIKLQEYVNKNPGRNKFENISTKICQNGGSVQSGTVESWLKKNSNTKFPDLRNLIALKKMLNDNEFDHDFEEILRNRRIYNGIMISTGRSLSDEIADYILYKHEGEILKNIGKERLKSMIDENLRKRILKSINVVEEE